MTGNKSTKANRINIVDPVYAVIQSDTKEGTTYGEVKKLGAAMPVSYTHLDVYKRQSLARFDTELEGWMQPIL